MKLNYLPKVSVITVVYNDKDGIESTMESVLNLQYQNKEYIIIDGGSTDGTVSLIQAYSAQLSHFITEKDRGIYDAMNKGIALASGDFINFMNSGDEFASDSALSVFENIDFANYDVIYGDAMVSYHTFKRIFERRDLQSFWTRMPFCHQAAFVKKELFSECNFNLAYKLSSDFDFLYRAYRGNKTFVYVPVLICNYEYRKGSSVHNAVASIRERKKIILSYDYKFGPWLYYTIYVAYVFVAERIKSALGKPFSEWIIRYLKKY